MPPKPKCTREEIAKTALEIIKENGLSSLTARELGKRLKASASPIFTVFESMDEVKMAARELALREFREYISDFEKYTPAFKRIGIKMVSYGNREPELFKLLFMQEHNEAVGLKSSLQDLGTTVDTCISLTMRDYDLSEDEAEILFEQLWIEAFGLGTMCAMKICDLSEEEIGRKLGTTFASLMMLIKSGKLSSVYSDVQKSSNGIYHGNALNDLPFKE